MGLGYNALCSPPGWAISEKWRLGRRDAWPHTRVASRHPSSDILATLPWDRLIRLVRRLPLMQLRLRLLLARHVRSLVSCCQCRAGFLPITTSCPLPNPLTVESSAALPQVRVSFSTRSDMGITRRRAHGISFELWRLSPREFPHTPTLASRLGVQRQPGLHGVVHCARHSIKASGGSTKKVHHQPAD